MAEHCNAMLKGSVVFQQILQHQDRFFSFYYTIDTAASVYLNDSEIEPIPVWFKH